MIFKGNVWLPSKARAPRRKTQSGTSAVEFALIVPVLLLVVFGVINFGIVLAQKASLANAVRSATRFGTVNAYSATTHTCQAVIDRVRDGSRGVGINDSNKKNVAVTVSFTNNTTGATSPVCTAAAGSATAPSGGSSLPCANVNGTPSTPDQLTVSATYASGLLVPTPGLGKTVSLSGSTSFLCEYYK